MSVGSSPYDHISPDFRPELDDTLEKVPGTRDLFTRGKVGRVVAELQRAGFTCVAYRLELSMPNMFST